MKLNNRLKWSKWNLHPYSRPKVLILCILFYTLELQIGCKKMISVPPPISTITTSQVFSRDDQANAAMAGIYFQMINGFSVNFCSGSISVYTGMSADELKPFNQNAANVILQFQNNNLIATNGNVLSNFWAPAYSYINSSNAILEGLSASQGVHDSVKNQLIGEAKFIRAFCYFYLTNLFGDVPLAITSNWNNTNLLSKSPSTQIYAQIIADLKDAQSRLQSDYSVSGGERTRVNKWAAIALLARTHLYSGDWSDAELEATSIINNTATYRLTDSLNSVFSKNSSETIWQLQLNSAAFPYNATLEGNLLIPPNSTLPAYAYLTPQLFNTFETNDRRRVVWINSTNYTVGGVTTTYYYPYKYIIGPTQATANSSIPQYYMVLRLAEQYLIRAEARAQQNKLDDAISDLNIVRKRAGLPNTTATTQSDLLIAIAHERQVELFAEWGHRWLDLKRTNQATAVLGSIKPGWTANAQLYPIPVSELKVDPNLKQNPGYN